ncbi:MAG: type II secretion system secretin GspD [Proteobacteria bacterium]|nr:type II secretion system secretin GspD [Pseudomonadota bacterium]
MIKSNNNFVQQVRTIQTTKLIAWLIFLALLSGCATTPLDLSNELDNPNYLGADESEAYSGAVFGNDDEDTANKEQFEYYTGTGEFINKEAASRHQRAVSTRGEITFNFEGEPLQAVVHLILGEILKENYVIAPGVSGNVTFATAKPVGKEQILPILELLLSWNNSALVQIDDRYHVLPKNKAIKGNLTPRMGSIDQVKGYQVIAVPLAFISPSEMEKILEPYIKEGAIVKADNSRNILFLAGTNQELGNYMDTIEIFDVDWLAGMSTGIFYLKRVEATDVIVELEALFGEGAETPLAGMFRFMPLERLNAILVITPLVDYLDKAQEWILRLDRADSEGSSNLYVYSVKNIKADDLAGYLNDVFGGTGGSSSSRKANTGGSVVPGQRGREVSSTNNRNTKNKTKPARARSSSATNSEVQITAIEESNQLLIKASVGEYEQILSAIDKLDIEPLQVLIELKIIEVSLNDSMDYGMELFFGDAVAEPADFTGRSDRFDTTSATFGAAGLSYVFKGFEVEARLDALQSEGRVSLISSPSIMVLNNKNATINVGEQIPIVSTSIGNGNNGGNNNFRTNSTRFIQTGVQVDITPRVNPGGLVYMEISQDVSTPGTPAEGNVNPPINTRELNTEIAVQSGDTIVMGGLISINDITRSGGVPFLNRIPIIGAAFGKNTKSIVKTELMLLITPTVIRTTEQARRVTLEYAKKFQGLKPIKTSKNKLNTENE